MVYRPADRDQRVTAKPRHRLTIRGIVLIATSFDAVAETVKVASDKQSAVMIAKGVDRFPDNGDRVAGHLDVWWIVRILMCR